MQEYMEMVLGQLGLPIWLFVIMLIWSYSWKLLALWKSARKNSPVWFIILALVNTMGIVEILYIFVFSKMNFPKMKMVKSKSSKKKKKR